MQNEWATEGADNIRLQHSEEDVDIKAFIDSVAKHNARFKHILQLSHLRTEIDSYVSGTYPDMKQFRAFLNLPKFSNPLEPANINFVCWVARIVFNSMATPTDIKFDKFSNRYFYEDSLYRYYIPFDSLDLKFQNKYKVQFIRERLKPKRQIPDNWFTKKIDYILGIDKMPVPTYRWKETGEGPEVLDLPPKGFDGEENWILSYIILTRIGSIL